MKKNDWLLLASATLFSVLFYKQSPGLNYLLFTLLLSGLIAVFNPNTLKQAGWWYYAGLSVLCGLSVFICNSALSIFSTLLSTLILSGKSYNVKNSLIVTTFFAFYSMVSSPVYALIDLNRRILLNRKDAKSSHGKIYLGMSLALVFSIIFFALYQQANPLFKKFTGQIDLSWITNGWLFFTMLGFLVMYGLLFHRTNSFVVEWDLQANRTISGEQDRVGDSSGNAFMALTLFAVLNVMLFFLNALDVNNLFINRTLPEGITLSDFVHSSVLAIVFSILIAVALIIYFFRNELNFNKHSRRLKSLVYVWIAQSAIMILSAMVRNSWYIHEYQLTYLRIGVYLFLFLSLVGLFFTLLKLQRVKTGWYLVRQNFEAWFLILALCSLVNWDKYITTYNIANAKNYESLDKPYLLDLSDAALPEVTRLMFNNAKITSLKDPDFQKLSSALYNFYVHGNHLSWQEFNLRDRDNSNKIQQLINEKRISLLALNLTYDLFLADLSGFYNIRALSINHTSPDFENIAFFTDLEHLVIENFNIAEAKKLVLNKKLKYLEITGNLYGAQNLDLFNNLKNLHQLVLPVISNQGLLALNHHPSLKILEVKKLYQEQIDFIKSNHLSFLVKLTDEKP